MEIKDIKKNLDMIRKSRELWHEFAYCKSEDSHMSDKNHLKRYALAIELQYNWKPEDQELIQFLLENEVESRENDPWQGYDDSLILLSYLLAKFRNPENVWLYARAKCANFDTYCGYDAEFVFSAGVEATCHYLENHEITEDHGYLYEYKDCLRSLFTEHEIEKFLDRMKRRFPDRIEEESITSLLDRAIEFEDHEEAERLFCLLEKERESDARILYQYARELKNYKKALYYRNKLAEKADSLWDRVSSLHEIAKLYYLDGDYIHAFETAKKWKRMLTRFGSWKRAGLGRSLTEFRYDLCQFWFDLCLGFFEQNNQSLARISFKKGDQMLRKIKSHSVVLLEKAVMCSEKLNISNKRRYYKRLLAKEKRRIGLC